MIPSQVQILGVKIDKVTLEDAKVRVQSYLHSNHAHCIFTPNAEMLMLAQKDLHLKKLLNEADLTIPDGAGVVLASRLLKTPVPERVAGFDLVHAMFSSGQFQDTPFFFLGTRKDILEKAVSNLRTTYNLNIVGAEDGYFKEEDTPQILEKINASNAKILLVAMGAPRQEKWIDAHKSKLNTQILIGVGGSLDVFAGVAKRAPLFFQRNHLEWLYRLYQEPWRYKRMLNLPLFMFSVLRSRFSR